MKPLWASRAAARLTTAAAIAVVTATATIADTASPSSGCRDVDDVSNVGVFTGELAKGMPVFRLPPIEVVAHRKLELARMADEERRVRVIQSRARAETKRST
jgi:hypothetical protein